MLKLLILVRPFGKTYPKHNSKYEFLTAIKEVADVCVWPADGDIHHILRSIPFRPDFIFHYDVTANYIFAPRVANLDQIRIPVGAYVIDAHTKIGNRIGYFEKNKISLIFSATYQPFLARFPQYKSQFRFLPFSVNPKTIKNWNVRKDIDFLLMGLTLPESYPFRAAVLERMKHVKGFVYHPHPGHLTPPKAGLIVDELYGRELARAKIFFTCGSKYGYPVMKYFEAPGCGALLLAEPNPDILRLGFKDGVHFVACDRTDFFDKAMHYLRYDQQRNRIAGNGFRFVHAGHTHKQRAKQLVQYIQRYLGGNG